jgi:2-oxoisovalerate dehydrogenase E1 component
MEFIEEYKKAYKIRKIEEFFLEMFKLGKISGTVHTCVGQEFSGVFAAKYSIQGDYVVSNHRGHGHYISYTDDVIGLIAELLGNVKGCSKGIGGSQHLYNQYFFSNGIQGGMLPTAAGLAYENKLSKKNNISIAFLGDGTLGEGILYETLNISSLWNIPIVYILEKNSISQSTSFDQSFSGSISDRIRGFGINHYYSSIYDITHLDYVFKEAFEYSRNNSKPVFIEVELARLNSHSKGDDNRADDLIFNLIKLDPLNVFIENNKEIVSVWDQEIDLILNSVLTELNESIIDNEVFEKKLEISKNKNVSFQLINIDKSSNSRYNELIYNELDSILSSFKNSVFIGEDIENNNLFNPKEYGGAFKVSRDLSNKYPERVLNTPISEQAITGFSIGMALRGNVSIVEIMFGDFTTLAFDQLLQHVSKFTLMYGVKLDLPFILRTPMGGFRGYGPTHSQCIEKHFLGIPGLKVIALNQLIHPSIIFSKILKDRQPVLLVENKSLYTKKMYENLIDGYDIEINIDEESFPVVKLRSCEGNSVLSIVCYGGIVDEVLKAVEFIFLEEEILVDIFVVSDISIAYVPGLIDSLSKTKKLCIVEEGNSFASFSSEVVSNLIENNCVAYKLLRISNNSIVPSSRELEQNVLPTSFSISTAIIKFVK